MASGSATAPHAATWATGATSASTWPRSPARQNLITATVGTWGVFAPVAQMSDRTAFLLESEATGTPQDQHARWVGWWKRNRAIRPLDRSSVTIKNYFASGPGEEIDAANTTGTGIRDRRPAQTGFAPAHPMRDSIFPGTTSGPLGRHHWRQLLGVGSGRAAAHGVFAQQARAKQCD